MDFVKYQQEAAKTALYGSDYKVTYPALGLAGEAGEVANKVKKILRDDKGVLSDEVKSKLQDELGDVLWYCAALATDLGISLESVAVNNLNKLNNRKAAGTIGGSGDNR